MEETKKNWVQQSISTINTLKDVPDGLFELPPFPKVRADKSQAIVLAFCRRQHLAHPERLVTAPYRVIEASYPDLDRIEDREVAPEDFGVDSPADSNSFVGNLKELDRLSGDESLSLRRRYRELLSMVLERKWLVGGMNAPDLGKEIASEMRDILSKTTPRALAPYYEWLGRDLNHWFTRVAPKKAV